jgi:hypothetical protein
MSRRWKFEKAEGDLKLKRRKVKGEKRQAGRKRDRLEIEKETGFR